jgi:hypothetical protein
MISIISFKFALKEHSSIVVISASFRIDEHEPMRDSQVFRISGKALDRTFALFGLMHTSCA